MDIEGMMKSYASDISASPLGSPASAARQASKTIAAVLR